MPKQVRTLRRATAHLHGFSLTPDLCPRHSILLTLTLMPVLASLLLPRLMKETEPWVVRLAQWLYGPLLRLLPDGCLDRLFLLFPDPWPKTRHAKRRFVHPALLPVLGRVLKAGAEWRVASDDPTYQAWVAEVMAEQALFDVTSPAPGRPEDCPVTRYDAKALREGRLPRYWTFIRRLG